MDSFGNVDEILLLKSVSFKHVIIFFWIQFYKSQLKSNLPSLWFIFIIVSCWSSFSFFFRDISFILNFSAKTIPSKMCLKSDPTNKIHRMLFPIIFLSWLLYVVDDHFLPHFSINSRLYNIIIN